MSVRFAISGLALLLASAAPLAGCGLFASSGPSAVAQGNYYASGNAAFDAFFIELYRLQVDMAKAPERPSAARTLLAESVGLNPEASVEQIVARVKEEAERLRRASVLVRLELPEPSNLQPGMEAVTLQTSTQPTSERDKALLSKFEAIATELFRTRSVMLATKRKLEQLRSRAIALETQVDSVFRLEGPWKRDEVRTNLSDGDKLITLMTSRSDEVTVETDKLLEPLRQALTTDGGRLDRPAAAEPEKHDQPEPAKKRSRPTRKPSRGSTPSAKPARKPEQPATKAPAVQATPAPAPKPPPPAPRDFEP